MYIAPGATVLGDIAVGADSSIWFGCVVRAELAPVRIGMQTNIQDLTMVHVDEGVPCTVGDRVSVGHRAILHGCRVEDEALVGMGAILLNDVVVGAGAVIAAGALVTEGTEVPAGALVMGVPGRVVGPASPEVRARAGQTWRHYTQLALQHRNGEFVRHEAGSA